MVTEVESWFKSIDEQIATYNDYYTRGAKIENKYRNGTCNFQTVGVSDPLFSSYNMLYSNTELLRPILYNRTPRAEVRATSKRNVLARKAAEILERCLNNSCKAYDFDNEIISSINDYLLPGQGLSRISYSPLFQKLPDGEEKKIYEEVRNNYEAWDSVIIGPANRWEDVPWIAFRGNLRKDEVKEQFGDEFANKLKYTSKTDIINNNINAVESEQDSNMRVAEIYEVWDKEKREVLFISRQDTNSPLLRNKEPLELQGFFPMPRPLFSAVTNNSIIPVPFFIYYEDLQNELEIVTTRIERLIEFLKIRGVYDSKVENINQIYNASDNELVSVENFNRLVQQGGIDSVINMLDIAPIAGVVQQLYQYRDQIRFSIFEIMGISDIQRAVSDPRETATAAKLKGQFGSLRVSYMQREVQRYIRDIYRIKGEIISEEFSPEVIALISDTPLQEVLEVMPLIRMQEPRMIAIDIETDSTIEANQQQEKEQAVEFINAMTQLSQVLPALASSFGLDVAGEISIAAVRKFKMSRGLEDMLEDRLELVKQQQQAQQSQEQQPDADMIKAMNEQARIQLDAQKLQSETSLSQQKMQLEAQLKVADLQLRAQELEMKAIETNSSIDIAEASQAIETAELLLKQQQVDLEKEKVEVEAANPNVNTVVGV